MNKSKKALAASRKMQNDFPISSLNPMTVKRNSEKAMIGVGFPMKYPNVSMLNCGLSAESTRYPHEFGQRQRCIAGS